MIAVPCSPIEPETRIRSPGAQPGRRERRARVDLRRSRSCTGTSSRRGRARRPSCRRRRSRRRPRAAAAAIASTSAPQLLGGEALLEHQRERERERPRAGHRQVVDRAVDGQLADRAAGEADRLDDEAVGRERQLDRAADRDRAGVGRAPRARREPSAGTSRPSISVWVALPPAPWAIVIRSSRNLGGLERTVSMISSTRCSRSVGSAARGTVTPPHGRGRSGRSCSRPRRRPRATPCTCRSRARACRRCRTPCTPRA